VVDYQASFIEQRLHRLLRPSNPPPGFRPTPERRIGDALESPARATCRYEAIPRRYAQMRYLILAASVGL